MNLKELSEKYLLLDADVLINYTKLQVFYQEFFDELLKYNITPLISPLVKFELLRYAKTKKQKESIEDFFSKVSITLDDMEMPLSPEALSNATLIGNIYRSHLESSTKGISITDCHLAAEMAEFNIQKQQLFLATENHKDFPDLLFQREEVITIDVGGNKNDSIHNIGIYSFKADSYKEFRKDFE